MPDWKRPKRIKDSALLRGLHIRGVTCVICGQPGSLHHIYPKGQGGDDVRQNLIGLCPPHHGLLHDADSTTLRNVGAIISFERPDTIAYIQSKLGDEEGREWLSRRFLIAM